MDRTALSPQSWSVGELADFLGLRPRTIHDRLSRRPHLLPVRIKSGGKAPPRWLVEDVLTWARGEPLATMQPAAYEGEGVRRGRGRPRKLSRGGTA